MGRHPDTSMKTTPQSASCLVGACRIAPLMAAWPRGSFISNSRMWSRFSMKYSRLSFMVAPGMTPTPPVTTRVGIPSVWESTAVNIRFARITQSSRPQSLPNARTHGSGHRASFSSLPVAGSEVVECLLGAGSHCGFLLGAQRPSRWPGGPTVAAAGDVDAELDGLHELRL